MVFRAQPLPGDLNRRPEAPGPDLQLENSPKEVDPPEHCHTVKNYRGGTAEKGFVTEKKIYIYKNFTLRLIEPIMGSRARPVASALCRLDSKSNERA